MKPTNVIAVLLALALLLGASAVEAKVGPGTTTTSSGLKYPLPSWAHVSNSCIVEYANNVTLFHDVTGVIVPYYAGKAGPVCMVVARRSGPCPVKDDDGNVLGYSKAACKA